MPDTPADPAARTLPDLFPGFEARYIDVSAGRLFARIGGKGPPLLLLHGYPQTHVEWHRLAPSLAERFTVVVPDLRGYGASFLPTSRDGEAMSKRAMGRDMVELMAKLGHQRFRLVGHDRGGRVAYRLAFDDPKRLERVAVLDIIPTAAMFRDMGRAKSALNKYHWLFLAQPEPFPERLIGAEPVYFLEHTLAGWTATKDLSAFAPEALAHYRAAFDAPRIHTSCECYRAGAFIDRPQDEQDLKAGRRIEVPLLALWGDAGIPASGMSPLDVWREYARDVDGRQIRSGHFLPEENPEDCLAALLDVLD